MYPDKIRAQALRFILMQIACGVTGELIASLLNWPLEEMQCFFSDLLTVMRMLWYGSIHLVHYLLCVYTLIPQEQITTILPGPNTLDSVF